MKPKIRIKMINEKYNIRGDDFRVNVPICVDQDGHSYFNEPIDNVAVSRAIMTYRLRHNMLLPSDIDFLRNSFKEKNMDLAKALSIPEKALDNLIKFGALPDRKTELKLEGLYHKVGLDFYNGKSADMLKEFRQKD